MKIAVFHELHNGGARRSVVEFGKRLKKKYTVDLYYVDEVDNKKEKQFFHNVYFYQFIPKKWTGGDWKIKLYKDTIELYHLFKLHKKIAYDIEKKKYDVVLIEPSRFTQAPFLLRFLTTRKVYFCQEPLRMVYEDIFAVSKTLPFYKHYYEKLNRYIRKHIDKANMVYANTVVGNSRYTKKNIEAAYKIKSTHCYLGVDTNIFKPIKIKKDIDILFVGSYDITGGYDLLEKARNFLKGKPVIKILASEKQWIQNDTALRKLYNRSKIALALSYNEPFGLIPVEAMACGVPVVAVNDGGYKETVKNNVSGLLIPRNGKILAEKLNFLLSRPDTLKKMEKNARALAQKNWDWDVTIKRLEKILLINR